MSFVQLNAYWLVKWFLLLRLVLDLHSRNEYDSDQEERDYESGNSHVV
jgi:hypothetical protein